MKKSNENGNNVPSVPSVLASPPFFDDADKLLQPEWDALDWLNFPHKPPRPDDEADLDSWDRGFPITLWE